MSIFQIIGSLSLGKAADKFSFTLSRYIAITLAFLTFLVTYISFWYGEFWFTYIVGALVGYTQIGVSTLTTSILSKHYA